LDGIHTIAVIVSRLVIGAGEDRERAPSNRREPWPRWRGDFQSIEAGETVTLHDDMPRYEGLVRDALWLARPRVLEWVRDF